MGLPVNKVVFLSNLLTIFALVQARFCSYSIVNDISIMNKNVIVLSSQVKFH